MAIQAVEFLSELFLKRVSQAIREALDIVDTEQSINLDEFNTDYDNGDLYIDSITIFHSGYGAEWGVSSCATLMNVILHHKNNPTRLSLSHIGD